MKCNIYDDKHCWLIGKTVFPMHRHPTAACQQTARLRVTVTTKEETCIHYRKFYLNFLTMKVQIMMTFVYRRCDQLRLYTLNWWHNEYLKERGRVWPWCYSRNHTEICLQGLTESQKKAQRLVNLQAGIWKRDIARKEVQRQFPKDIQANAHACSYAFTSSQMLVEPPTGGFISHMKRDHGTQYEHVLKR
jgi:hypothetical protein